MTGPRVHRDVNAPLLLIALVLTALSYQLSGTMVNPLLPLISSHYGMNVGSASIVMSSFFTASSVGGLVLSRWSDTIGRRRSLLIVIALIGVGTFVCAIAPSFTILVIGRVLQGLGSAVFPLSTLVIRESLPSRMFGIAIGIIAAFNGGVLGLDGVLSGWLAIRFGFQSVFWVLLVLALLAGTLIWISLPDCRVVRGSMDWKGAIALSVIVVAISQVISAAAGGQHQNVLLWGAIFVMAAAGSWLSQRNSPDPIFSWSLVKSRTFWPVCVTTALGMAGLGPMVTYSVVLFAQEGVVGFGLEPALAAFYFLTPFALGGVLMAPIGGWIGSRFGWAFLLRMGLIMGVLSTLLLAFAAQILPVAIAASFMAGAATNGMSVVGVNSLSVLQSPTSAPASLPALNSASFGIGTSIGISLLAPQVAEGSADGYATAFMISGLLAVLAIGFTFVVKEVPASEQES